MVMLPTRRSMRNRSLADPTREFEDIYQRMGQLMNAAFTDFALAPPGDAPWIPAAEESDTEDAYVVRVEVPGVRKDQLHVQVTDRELTITGEISETESGHRRRSSRRTGQFEYRTMLPGDIKADQVTAELADGLLTVTLPKAEEAKPNRVQISG
ncbi:MAG TPA: Hsp20/alpha crystallin family protein [Streptosporangiaceae bacterium]